MNIAEAFGRKVKIRREALGLSQGELGGVFGMVSSNVSSIECGRHRPGVERIFEMASVLSIDLSDIVSRMPVNDQRRKLAEVLSKQESKVDDEIAALERKVREMRERKALMKRAGGSRAEY